MAKSPFDLKPLFARNIIRVRSDLLPEGFEGSVKDRAVAKKQLAWCIERMGKLSAKAQGMHAAATTIQKLNEKDSVYLLAAVEDGLVIGMLKVGFKDLYLFNEQGQISSYRETPAILDFHVHKSHQRCGLGKRLIEYMLADQGWSLGKCAFVSPSAMMRAFLAKHYKLVKPVPQSNKFVLFKDFFRKDDNDAQAERDYALGLRL